MTRLDIAPFTVEPLMFSVLRMLPSSLKKCCVFVTQKSLNIWNIEMTVMSKRKKKDEIISH